MFRLLGRATIRFGISSGVPKWTTAVQNVARINYAKSQSNRNFSSALSLTPQTSLRNNPNVIAIANNIATRNYTKLSYRKGRRKAVKVVLRKFYRLNWGGWIRTKCGRNKKLWKKSPPRKRRLRQHVFCNATQSKLLDKMVGAYWLKPRHYVDDPYNPYHVREEFMFSAKKPRPFIPPDQLM